MATFDIEVTARTGQSAPGGGQTAFTPPGDFDGATINSVAIVGSPLLASEGVTDDTIGIYFWIKDTGGINDIYGTNTTSGAVVTAELGDSVASATLVDGASPTPAPTIAVAEDWDRVQHEKYYTANMKNDGETMEWPTFFIRVTYTPGTPPGWINYYSPTRKNILLRM
jgi:hypothetical protein